MLIREASGVLGFDLDTPFNKLGKAIQKEILHGTTEEVAGKPFEGVIPHLARLFVSTKSDYLKSEISRYMSTQSCPACNGARLKKESLSVTIAGKNIWEVIKFSINDSLAFFQNLKFNEKEKLNGYQVLK